MKREMVECGSKLLLYMCGGVGARGGWRVSVWLGAFYFVAGRGRKVAGRGIAKHAWDYQGKRKTSMVCKQDLEVCALIFEMYIHVWELWWKERGDHVIPGLARFPSALRGRSNFMIMIQQTFIFAV